MSRKVSKAFQKANSQATPELGWNKGVIVLTDSVHYPRHKVKRIDANLEGVSTPELHKMHERMFHLMMCFESKDCMGYVVTTDSKDVREELVRRGEKPYGS